MKTRTTFIILAGFVMLIIGGFLNASQLKAGEFFQGSGCGFLLFGIILFTYTFVKEKRSQKAQ